VVGRPPPHPGFRGEGGVGGVREGMPHAPTPPLSGQVILGIDQDDQKKLPPLKICEKKQVA